MKIKIQEALELFSKAGCPLYFLSDVSVKKGDGIFQIKKGMKYDSSFHETLQQAGMCEINVIFTPDLLKSLNSLFPRFYRFPRFRKSIVEIDRVMEKISLANSMSKRKRCIISAAELYKKNEDGYSPYLQYGEKIDDAKWNEMKMHLGRSGELDFSYGERGIVLLYMLRKDDPEYAKKFIRFSGLISMLVESEQIGVPIAPDFHPGTDVYSVTDRSKLMETYMNSNAGMVLIGEETNAEYEAAVNQLVNFDRFARLDFINYGEIKDKKEILKDIRSKYMEDLF